MLNIKTIFIQLVNFVGFFFALRDKRITPPPSPKKPYCEFSVVFAFSYF